MSTSYKNSYKAPRQNLISLSIHNSGYQKCTPSHQWGPGIRDHYLLHYVISGKGYCVINQQTYTLSSGDSFLASPFEEVTYYADSNTPWEYAWVGFSGSDAKTILQSTPFFNVSPIVRSSTASENIKKHLLQIYNARGSHLLHTVEMVGELYLLLAQYIDSQGQPNTSHAKSAYPSYVDKGIEFIHANYSYPISILDIADYVGVSRSHLFRAFQSVTGHSTKEYLTQFRIKQACILLKHSQLSVSAIGRSVGFEDNLNFSKVFKKQLGKSPSHYRLELSSALDNVT